MANDKSFMKISKSKIPSPFQGKKNGKKAPMNSILKTVGIYVLIGLAIMVFVSGFSGAGDKSEEIPLSQVINEVKEDKVDKISLEGEKVIVDYANTDET